MMYTGDYPLFESRPLYMRLHGVWRAKQVVEKIRVCFDYWTQVHQSWGCPYREPPAEADPGKPVDIGFPGRPAVVVPDRSLAIGEIVIDVVGGEPLPMKLHNFQDGRPPK